jgi:hypothetical protein
LPLLSHSSVTHIRKQKIEPPGLFHGNASRVGARGTGGRGGGTVTSPAETREAPSAARAEREWKARKTRAVFGYRPSALSSHAALRDPLSRQAEKRAPVPNRSTRSPSPTWSRAAKQRQYATRVWEKTEQSVDDKLTRTCEFCVSRSPFQRLSRVHALRPCLTSL